MDESINRIEKKDNNEYLCNDIEYDIVIRCTGFKFDDTIFDISCKPEIYNNKIPILKGNYESKNIKNLFFGGTLTQFLDYKKCYNQ